MSWPRDADGFGVREISIKERLDALEAEVALLQPYRLPGLELAYAENSTGVPTTIPISGAASVSIPWCLIEVSADQDPVWVEYGGEASVLTSGSGLISLELWDVTNGGVGTNVHDTSFGNVAAQAVLYSGLGQSIVGRHRLEPSPVSRLFQLKTLLYRDAAGLTAQILNSTRVGAPYGYSYIRAVHG